MAESAKKKKDEEEKSEEEKKDNFDAEKAAEEFFKALGVDPEKLIKKLKKIIAEAMETTAADVTDEQVMKTVESLHKSGKLDKVLREVGLVPKPGFISAVTGWHDIEHMRSKGFSNKAAGFVGLATKLAVVLYGIWKGYEYLSR